MSEPPRTSPRRAWPSCCARAPSWSTCARRTSTTPATSPDDRHIELEQLPAEAGTLDRERPMVFYCRSGSRSALAAQAFAAAGFEAHNLDGGLLAWVATACRSSPPTATWPESLSSRSWPSYGPRPGEAGGAAAGRQLHRLVDRPAGAQPVGEAGGEAVAAAVGVAHRAGQRRGLPAARSPSADSHSPPVAPAVRTTSAAGGRGRPRS